MAVMLATAMQIYTSIVLALAMSSESFRAVYIWYHLLLSALVWLLTLFGFKLMTTSAAINFAISATADFFSSGGVLDEALLANSLS